jgi:arylsulfatase A-like enzyme
VINLYYDYTDKLVGEILARRRPGDTFIVLSDHGFHARGHADGPDGIFIAAGRNIRRGAELREPHILDITPTALTLLGLPTAADMDGRVLEELFTDDWRAAYPHEKTESYDTENWREQIPVPSNVDAELLRRLHALGYLE